MSGEREGVEAGRGELGVCEEKPRREQLGPEGCWHPGKPPERVKGWESGCRERLRARPSLGLEGQQACQRPHAASGNACHLEAPRPSAPIIPHS